MQCTSCFFFRSPIMYLMSEWLLNRRVQGNESHDKQRAAAFAPVCKGQGSVVEKVSRKNANTPEMIITDVLQNVFAQMGILKALIRIVTGDT